jgi:hypothetical protein
MTTTAKIGVLVIGILARYTVQFAELTDSERERWR